MQLRLTERQVEIAEMVRNSDFLTVDHLAAHFDVTTQTIRRDLNLLCDEGLVRRRHGGVEMPPQSGNLTYRGRKILNNGAKRQIAAAVAQYVPAGASLAFSIGTTPEVVAEALLEHDALRIFTNNLNVAMLASGNAGFEVSVPEGRIRSDDLDILGPGVERFFSSYFVDFGIYGVAGVEADGTLLDFREEEVQARQVIRANCQKTILVLDQSKFSRRAPVRGGRIEEADFIFCNAMPPDPIVALIEQSQAKLVLCKGEA